MTEIVSLQTFLTPPTFRVALAERPRLLAALRDSNDRRVVLIDAPAGYGKTWLLARRHAQLRAAGACVVWLGVEEADARQFLTMLVKGLARAGVDVAPVEALAAQGFADVPVPAAVRALAAALESRVEPVHVFVDDIHRLEREAVSEVLARLVAEASPATRFFCSGRDCSGLPRAALRARGDLLELGVDELRFEANEARELLHQLDVRQVDRLLARTEGWPVALQLARLWIEAKPSRSSLLDAFSGGTSEVAEYLTEQVLRDLSPELQEILLDVSVLDTVNPDLVHEIVGSPKAWARLLEDGRLEHFLVPLDEERYWFRLHHLLLDYLRVQRRDRGLGATELHSRAASWFERHGRVREAVRHAVLADDIGHAAALVERTGGWELALFGGAALMRALLGALPAERLPQLPRVQLFQAFLAAKDGDVARGLRLYEEVAADSKGSTDRALARDQLVVGYLIRCYADQPVTSEELTALYREFEALPENDNTARAALLNTACLLALALGTMPAALDACTRAVHEMRRIGSVLGLNYCLCHLGLTQLHMGERREAEATLREAAAMAEENFGADSGLKAIADAHLALALHARGEIAATSERITASLEQIESADGWLDLFAEAYEVALANAIVRGDSASTARLIQRMESTAARRRLVRLARLASAFRAQIAVLKASPGTQQQGTSREAIDAASLQEGAKWQPGIWRSTPHDWRAHHAAGVVRVLAAIESSRPADAIAVLDDLEAAAQAGGRRRHSRVLGTLRAAVRLKLGEADEALTTFIGHLEPAVREDDTQFLVDFGRVLMPLLQRAWAWSREQAASSRVRHVLAVAVTTLARAATVQEAPGPLSSRELEVLVELASGAPNKVIARNLQMTENTVKFHLKRVFQKLQVRHRAAALQAARSRGLLP